jgi:SAM-dependent methyltransferase
VSRVSDSAAICGEDLEDLVSGLALESPLVTSNVEPYDPQYFAWQKAGAFDSARALLPVVLDLVSPRSILDVGCGTGAWLRTAMELGVRDVLGVDGGTAERVIPAEHFRQIDLENPLELDRRFDLVICMEVAEHLSPDRGPSLVGDLCRAADVILFSAAIPGQDVPDSPVHQNEQWQSYWANIFCELEYRTVDAIRPVIWNNNDVAFWYRQNAFIALAPSAKLELEGPSTIADVVHPELWRSVNPELWASTASPRQLLRRLPTALKRSARHRLRR